MYPMLAESTKMYVRFLRFVAALLSVSPVVTGGCVNLAQRGRLWHTVCKCYLLADIRIVVRERFG